MSIVVALLAPEIIEVLLGRQWSGAVVPLQILALGILFRTSYKLSDFVARATGAVYARAWRQGLYAAAIAAMSFIGQNWGVRGVAVGVVAAVACNFLLMAHLSLRLTDLNWRTFGAAHVPGLLLAVAIGVLTWWLASWLREMQTSPILVLVASASTASVAALLLWRQFPGVLLGSDAQSLLRAIAAMTPAPFQSPCFGWLKRRLSMVGRIMSEASTPALARPSANMPPPVAASPSSLALVSSLFKRLNEAAVAYCHWKSNEHLAAAAAGLTDLDVLIDRSHQLELQRIVQALGFKRFATPPLRAYPAVEDYIGLDQSTGRLAHLHLHYELTLGERYLKGYRLPWEARILATRRLDPEHNIYVADPAIELLLLFVRSALKQRWRDGIRRMLSGARASGQTDFERELTWLQARVQEANVLGAAHDLLGPSSSSSLKRLLAEPMSASALAAFAAACVRRCECTAPMAELQASLLVWARELHWYADAVNRRYLHRPIPMRRISPRGGTVIVIVGSDGSGKSTLSRTLQSWLGWKLDVMPIYFGSGDGHAAFYRQPLRLAHRYLRPFLGRSGSSRPSLAQEPTVPHALARDADDGSLHAAARVGRVWSSVSRSAANCGA